VRRIEKEVKKGKARRDSCRKVSWRRSSSVWILFPRQLQGKQTEREQWKNAVLLLQTDDPKMRFVKRFAFFFSSFISWCVILC
jgi:hypothetical protein